jgi:hypothetical protein
MFVFEGFIALCFDERSAAFHFPIEVHIFEL